MTCLKNSSFMCSSPCLKEHTYQISAQTDNFENKLINYVCTSLIMHDSPENTCIVFPMGLVIYLQNMKVRVKTVDLYRGHAHKRSVL